MIVGIRKFSGFTLIELMIVVAVVAILASIAYPSYQDQITKTRRTDGHTVLLDAINRQERFFTNNNTYSTSLVSLSYTVDGNGKADSEEGHYKISARQCGVATCNTATPQPLTSCVEILAEPQGSQSADGNLSYDSRGAKCPVTGDKW